MDHFVGWQALAGFLEELVKPCKWQENGKMLERLKYWARAVRCDVHAVYLVSHDPRVPWYAKAAAICVAAYALSPLDLIPDFIPVLGHLDDVIIVPVALWLVVRLIPPDIMAEYRASAVLAMEEPASRAGILFVVAIWLLLSIIGAWTAYRLRRWKASN